MVITVLAPAEPVTKCPSGLTVQVIATPPDVSDVLGAPKMTVRASPFGSETKMTPFAVGELVVSGVPTVSGIPLVSPSSDTLTAENPITGGSFGLMNWPISWNSGGV